MTGEWEPAYKEHVLITWGGTLMRRFRAVNLGRVQRSRMQYKVRVTYIYEEERRRKRRTPIAVGDVRVVPFFTLKQLPALEQLAEAAG